MVLLDGLTLSRKILSELKLKIENYKLKISLHVILVGDDPNSQKYVDLKQKRCGEIGLKCIVHRLSANTKESVVLNLTTELNNDQSVTGYFVQLPMPSTIDKQKVISSISPAKDVDGLTDNSPYTPAVVRGVVSLLEKNKLEFTGKNAVIINDSKLIGIPLKNILEKKRCRVTICNEFTKNIQKISRGADYLFSATGVKGLITHDYIKPGAVVVDIGGGDVDFADVSPFCSFITPTIGGVGPMTIASLLQNLVDQNLD